MTRRLLSPDACSSAASAAKPTTADGLQAPHGGALVDLMLTSDAAKQAAVKECTQTIELSDRNACDVELLTVGGFSPLDGERWTLL